MPNNDFMEYIRRDVQSFPYIAAPPPRHVAQEVAAMKAMQAASDNRITKHGITVSVRDGYVGLMRGTDFIPVQPDEINELCNDLRVVASKLGQSANTTAGGSGAASPRYPY